TTQITETDWNSALLATKAGVVQLTQEVAPGRCPPRRAGQLGMAVDDPDRADGPCDPRAPQSAADRDASAGRPGTPEDLACANLFPASGCSSWIIGVTPKSPADMLWSGFPVGSRQRTEAMPCSSSWLSSCASC